MDDRAQIGANNSYMPSLKRFKMKKKTEEMDDRTQIEVNISDYIL